MEIKTLNSSNVEQAANLFAQNYALARQKAPILPERPADPAYIEPKLLRLAERNPGVALYDQEQLVGYICGLPVNDLKGKCASVYVPEWAHAADPHRAERVYEQLYSAISRTWVEAGWYQQVITILGDQAAVLDVFYQSGFGLQVEDDLRGMQDLPDQPAADIREVTGADVAVLADLEMEYAAYMHEAPSFLVFKSKGVQERAAWLALPGSRAWIAYHEGQPAGYLMIEKGGSDKAFVLDDPQTAGIMGAYMRPGLRGQGAMTALLQRGLHEYARQGYTRCAVDFETPNYLARHFWRKHFQTVCQSLIRRVDERLADLDH